MASPLRAQSWSAYHLSLAHISCHMPSRILSVRHVCKSPGWSCLGIWYLTISDFILILAECLRRYFLDGILKKYQYINKNINTEYLPKIPIQMATPMPLAPMCLTVFFVPRCWRSFRWQHLMNHALWEVQHQGIHVWCYPATKPQTGRSQKGEKIFKNIWTWQKHDNISQFLIIIWYWYNYRNIWCNMM